MYGDACLGTKIATSEVLHIDACPGAGRFVPVVIGGTPGHETGAAEMFPPSEDVSAEAAPATGQMEIVLSGDRRVIVDCAVDAPALARMIAVLEPR